MEERGNLRTKGELHSIGRGRISPPNTHFLHTRDGNILRGSRVRVRLEWEFLDGERGERTHCGESLSMIGEEVENTEIAEVREKDDQGEISEVDLRRKHFERSNVFFVVLCENRKKRERIYQWSIFPGNLDEAIRN